MLNKSKREYYESFFEKNKSNTSEIWKGIKTLITLKSKNKTLPTNLNINGNIITDPVDLANVFNEFFVNIGPSLSEKIPKTDKLFSMFLKNRTIESMFLNPVNTEEIQKIIRDLDGKKTTGPTSITITILKDLGLIKAK